MPHIVRGRPEFQRAGAERLQLRILGRGTGREDEIRDQQLPARLQRLLELDQQILLVLDAMERLGRQDAVITAGARREIVRRLLVSRFRSCARHRHDSKTGGLGIL